MAKTATSKASRAQASAPAMQTTGAEQPHESFGGSLGTSFGGSVGGPSDEADRLVPELPPDAPSTGSDLGAREPHGFVSAADDEQESPGGVVSFGLPGNQYIGELIGPLRDSRGDQPTAPGSVDFAIIGSDDRDRVKNTAAYPFSAICCLISSKNGRRARALGTGWIVAPRLIITAGHNVFNNPEWGSGWADAVEVTPGLSAQGAPPPFGSQTVQGRNQLLASDGWVRGGDPLVDYAGIILNQPFDSRTGSFAMNLFAPDLLQQMRLNVAGYPQQSDRIPPLTMWTGQGLLLSNGVRQQSLWYQIDTTPGESGSPLMYVPADAVNEKGDVVKPVYSVGVHNYGQAESNRNSATRITQPVLDNFSQWLKLAGG